MLTIASLGGLLGLIVSLPDHRPQLAEKEGAHPLPLRQLGILVAPFTVAYALLLIPRSASKYEIFDRYLVELLAVALSWIVRYYQERIRTRLPLAAVLAVSAMAIYGVATVHNMFSFYRARAAVDAELAADDVPDTEVDSGWETNLVVELEHSSHINDPHIVVPANAYVPAPSLPAGSCVMFRHDKTPHIRPIYGISFDPNACYGLAPFAPVHYSRWLASRPGSLYVVRYLPEAKR
ncbi:MAG: hypothetical protein ACP5E5_07310 [Acidobacteriaceae bacterium]